MELIQNYGNATRLVPVIPIDEEEGVPLPQLYASVLIEEDLKARRKTRGANEPVGSKPLDSLKDIFSVKNTEYCKRIFLKGEAGRGKTVLSMKLIQSWSEAKRASKFGIPESSAVSAPTRRMSDQSDLKRARLSGKAKRRNDEEELQECLSSFDLVFYVPMRYAKDGTTSVTDLVCDGMTCSQDTRMKIKQVLSNDNIHCLIILDGLDEWCEPLACRIQGFPDNHGLVNCTMLYTMRPWKIISLQLKLDESCDKVVEILGLKGSSIKTVIRNVLIISMV